MGFYSIYGTLLDDGSQLQYHKSFLISTSYLGSSLAKRSGSGIVSWVPVTTRQVVADTGEVAIVLNDV
jgi:hypothetical protein